MFKKTLYITLFTFLVAGCQGKPSIFAEKVKFEKEHRKIMASEKRYPRDNHVYMSSEQRSRMQYDMSLKK